MWKQILEAPNYSVNELGLYGIKKVYEQNVENSEIIVEQLKKCADSIEKLDYQMQEIRDGIDRG